MIESVLIEGIKHSHLLYQVELPKIAIRYVQLKVMIKLSVIAKEHSVAPPKTPIYCSDQILYCT